MLVFTIVSAVAGIIVAFVIARIVLSVSAGTEKMRDISSFIQQGARAFLRREYVSIGIFMALVVALLVIGFTQNSGPKFALFIALSYLLGASLSLLTGFIGMTVATRANARTAQAATVSFSKALQVAFYGGSVMGLSVANFGLLGLCGAYIVLVKFVFPGDLLTATGVLSGFSMGASSVALFARVGGGIYTKAADVGGDLVGKVEAGIPEDDPRNPAVIADNVGDNVGDVCGMGADLYESYVGALLSAVIIAAVSAQDVALAYRGIIFTFAVGAFGAVSSIFGTLFTRISKSDPQRAIAAATYGTAALLAVCAYFLSVYVFKDGRVFLPVGLGLLSGVLIGYVAQHYSTGARIHRIARAGETGVATNIIEGLSVGMRSTVVPLAAIAFTVIVSFLVGQQLGLSGFYGVALAGVGMLSITGITVTVDSYGPIADNAGGIAQMAAMGDEVRSVTDSLDAAGNTTAAIGKGFAIGSAALTALALFSAFAQATGAGSLVLDVLDARVLAGGFLGALLPFFFAASTMGSVGRTAEAVVAEVRRQWKSIDGLMEGKADADYARIVDITTARALREMILPGVVAFVAPIFVGSLFGFKMLGGFLAGSLLVGVPLAIFMANSGAAWDNAKKYVEGGALGGKGSRAHKAAVEGDTVGDPFKDTAGPSLNILLKMMAVVSLVFAPLMAYLNGLMPFTY